MHQATWFGATYEYFNWTLAPPRHRSNGCEFFVFLIFWLYKMCDLGAVIVVTVAAAVVDFVVVADVVIIFVVFIFDLVALLALFSFAINRTFLYVWTVGRFSSHLEISHPPPVFRFSSSCCFRCCVHSVFISSTICLHYNINGNCWYASF